MKKPAMIISQKDVTNFHLSLNLSIYFQRLVGSIVSAAALLTVYGEVGNQSALGY